jgi:nucleoside-diphosphate-sugar epimerase
MKLLVIGGAGKVGTMVAPMLAKQHSLRVFDLGEPSYDGGEYVRGDVNDPDALMAAAEGMESILYMAMGSESLWREPKLSAAARASHFDVNVKGLYLALLAAHAHGIGQAVYTSSMSVYARNAAGRFIADEDMPGDATHCYGFTKRLGEEVCRNACREWGMDINALRLFLPMPDEKWLAEVPEGNPKIWTAASDVARAILAALDFRAGFQAFTISGDYEQKYMSLAKAKRFLNWEPLARPNNGIRE